MKIPKMAKIVYRQMPAPRDLPQQILEMAKIDSRISEATINVLSDELFPEARHVIFSAQDLGTEMITLQTDFGFKAFRK